MWKGGGASEARMHGETPTDCDIPFKGTRRFSITDTPSEMKGSTWKPSFRVTDGRAVCGPGTKGAQLAF